MNKRLGIVFVVLVILCVILWDRTRESVRSQGGSQAPVDAIEDVIGAGSVEAETSSTLEAIAEILRELPGDRVPGRTGHAEARAMIGRRLGASGVEHEEVSIEWPYAPEKTVRNLVARLGSGAPEADVFVVSAHYDGVARSPGADDNGAAVAVLLLLADRLAGRAAEAEIRLIWFDAEEAGLVGSIGYVGALSAAERRRIRGVINLECIGFTDRRAGRQSLPFGVKLVFDPGDVGDFLLVASNVASRPFQQRVVSGLEPFERAGVFRVEEFGFIPGEGLVLPDIRRSDHAPFWDASIPAVMLTDTANFRNPNYHARSDTLETLDLPFVAATLDGLEAVLVDLARVGSR